MSKTKEFLQKVETLNATGKATTPYPVRRNIRAMISCGLLKASRSTYSFTGYRLPHGDVWLRLTDDGRKLLAD